MPQQKRSAACLDVEIVPISQNRDTGVVDVALVEPIGVQLQLPTLAEMQATPRATGKHLLLTKLHRAVARKAERLEDAEKLRAWAFEVKTRDEWKDRKTGVRVHATRRLDPLRAEAHHIVSRDDQAVRYDVRNGLCLSYATHFLVTRHVLRIEGTAYFTIGGARYIDATYPVFFVRQ